MCNAQAIIERCAAARTKPQWTELTTCQRSAIVAGALVQVTLLTAAQIDIARRSAVDIRGPKLLWRILTLINFVGPIAYFVIGRRRSAMEPSAESTIDPAAT
jgi:hypothetical protein